MAVTVSIVMPCFNAERHLPTSLASLGRQTCPAWELVAVDDGSTDGTRAYLLSQQDPRMRVISQANAGVSAARNAALAQCRGDYVAFLDADDTWAPGFIDRMLACLEADPSAVLAYCGWQNLGAEGGRSQPFIPPDYEGPGKTVALLEGCRWPIHACLTRRSAIEVAGGFETRLRIGEDYLLWMEVAAQGRIVRIPEVLAYYHHHDGPQATDDRALAALDTLKAKEIFLARHPEITRALGRERLGEIMWGPLITRASELYWRGNLEGARPLFRKALLSGHGSPRDKLRMLASLLPLSLHRLVARLLAR